MTDVETSGYMKGPILSPLPWLLAVGFTQNSRKGLTPDGQATPLSGWCPSRQPGLWSQVPGFQSCFCRSPVDVSWVDHLTAVASVASIKWKDLPFLFFLIFIYLAAPGLSCGTQDLQSLLWHVGPFIAICRLFSCSMWDLVPWPGMEALCPYFESMKS